MAKLIFSAIVSLDGYFEDTAGNFDWGEPDEEVFTFLNDLERPVGTYLYGRRMYETMRSWETEPSTQEQPRCAREFAELWRAADKIVYSTSLQGASTARTRVEREFDPVAVHQLKSRLERDVTVAGPTLASHAFAAGLVDECQLYVTPIVVGGGKPALPSGARLALELVREHRFVSGVVFLHYRVLR